MPLFLFEDTLKDKSFYFSDPVEEVLANEPAQVAEALEKIDQLRRRGHFVAGFVAYEAGYSFFPTHASPHKKPDLPLIHFYAFKNKNSGWPTEWLQSTDSAPPTLTNFSWDTSFETYENLQNEIRKNLFSGNIYQQNQTLQMSFSCSQDALSMYRHLRLLQKTPYTAYLNFPTYQILSFSPELFYKKTGENIFVEPMKGTSSISESAHVLRNDGKNISENLMIVDLLRNDLGRLAHPGSVVVDELFKVQTLETVHQMTSKISATIDKEMSILSLFEALFPCGSITGAPKWSSMQFIRDQESSPRGVYTGAIGFVEPNNDHCFNVAIRTITHTNDSFKLGIGGGIVADSQAQSEYKEALLKSRFLRKLNSRFFLFETFLFDGEKCRDLAMHLERLIKSANDFGFEMSKSQIEQDLLARVQDLSGAHKIKVKLMYDGEYQMEMTPLVAIDNGVENFGDKSLPLISLSSQKINSQDIFRKYKTSQRDLYDQEYLNATHQGLYDYVFLNEKDEIAEASRHNIFVNAGGRWKTPPLSAGALPGIARQKAIAQFQASEEKLTIADIRHADEIILTNSVRGCVPVLWNES